MASSLKLRHVHQGLACCHGKDRRPLFTCSGRGCLKQKVCPFYRCKCQVPVTNLKKRNSSLSGLQGKIMCSSSDFFILHYHDLLLSWPILSETKQRNYPAVLMSPPGCLGNDMSPMSQSSLYLLLIPPSLPLSTQCTRAWTAFSNPNFQFRPWAKLALSEGCCITS